MLGYDEHAWSEGCCRDKYVRLGVWDVVGINTPVRGVLETELHKKDHPIELPPLRFTMRHYVALLADCARQNKIHANASRSGPSTSIQSF